MFYSCDFIISGSDAWSEIYEFNVSKDSLMKIIYNYNNDPNVENQDSLFRIEDSNKFKIILKNLLVTEIILKIVV